MGSKRGVSVDPARQRERKNKNTMYVIVEIQGQQFKVENGKKLFVHYLGAEHGAVLEFDRSEERRVGKECRSRWSPYH